jgi:hypothetical protein
MNRQKLKEMIRRMMEVKLFKEENNIPDDEENPEKPKEPGLPSSDDFASGEPSPTPEPVPTDTPGDTPTEPTGDVPPAEPQSEPEPEKPSLVPPDYPAKDSEKVYVPGPQIPYIPDDQTDQGGEVIPAKDIAPPVSMTQPQGDYTTNPDIDVPTDAPEISKEITKKEAGQLAMQTKGKIFTVVFIKRTTGEERIMNCRLGVKKYLKGGSLPFDPVEKMLLPVYDLQKKDYRLLPLDGIKYIKVDGQLYKTI